MADAPDPDVSRPDVHAAPSTAGSTKPPIFIVGCHRSGTTLFRLILDSHPNISCGPETRFLRDLEKITDAENWPRMGLYGFDKPWWDEQVAALFAEFHQQYALRRGKTRWADKTPLYVNHLDYIDRLFPSCQVINLVRDGRDVVRSHRDTFSYWESIKAVEKWPRYIVAAEHFGARVGPTRYHEIRYERLVGETEKVLREVLDWLDEPWDDAVMHHTEKQHDVMDRYEKTTQSRRSKSGEGAVYKSRAGTAKNELDPLQKVLVKLRQTKTLKRLGYE